MKIGLYDPYLDTLGGGEKYIFTIANCFKESNQIDVFWDDVSIRQKALEQFSLDLEKVNFVPNIFNGSSNFWKKYKITSSYDVFFFLSDGSIPFLFAKKNYLHFQFPVQWVKKSVLQKIKLARMDRIICNSKFVKKYIDEKLNISSEVIYPPVHIGKKGSKKENIILSVGRFTRGGNEKKQDMLINAFKNLCDARIKNWKLVIIGSVLKKDEEFVEELKKLSQKYPIEILANVSYVSLLSWYEKASIYWHATGFNEDVSQFPEKAEHFGISTVEAMSFGAVPVVINKGGQPEIVNDEINGFLWNEQSELLDKTIRLINDKKLWQQFSRKSVEDSRNFSEENFCKNIKQLF